MNLKSETVWMDTGKKELITYEWNLFMQDQIYVYVQWNIQQENPSTFNMVLDYLLHTQFPWLLTQLPLLNMYQQALSVKQL